MNCDKPPNKCTDNIWGDTNNPGEAEQISTVVGY